VVTQRHSFLAQQIPKTLACAQNTRGRHNTEHHAAELLHLSRGLLQVNNTYSYGEFDGYKDWGGMCQQGKQIPQSPINIPGTKITEALANPTSELDFNYTNLTGATAANTGHGVQVRQSPVPNSVRIQTLFESRRPAK
jgi:carbonic anhydrase